MRKTFRKEKKKGGNATGRQKLVMGRHTDQHSDRNPEKKERAAMDRQKQENGRTDSAFKQRPTKERK